VQPSAAFHRSADAGIWKDRALVPGRFAAWYRKTRLEGFLLHLVGLTADWSQLYAEAVAEKQPVVAKSS